MDPDRTNRHPLFKRLELRRDRSVRSLSLDALPPNLAAAAREAGRVLRARGHRAWIVGGALRDVALGRTPKDVDLATDARPDEVEALFTHTIAVGKAFGTIVVPLLGVELQITTLRRESGYADGRRPERVEYGSRVEDDAARRDFTCNALYFDLGALAAVDPTGGLADLAAGRLRAVGAADARFREDGLRLWRLARFAAGYDLALEPATWSGARGALEALRGVSAERVLAELQRIAAGAAPGRATALLGALGVLEECFPGLERLEGPRETNAPAWEPDARDARLAGMEPKVGGGWRARAAVVERLGEGLDAVLFLGALLAPGTSAERERAEALLGGVRPSRDERRRVHALWDLCAELRAAAAAPAGEPWRERARALRFVRAAEFEPAQRLLRAQGLSASLAARLAEWCALAARVPHDARFPPPRLSAEDFEALGVPRGPLWRTLVREAEERQLGGLDSTHAEALAWLRARLAAEGEGGGRA